MLLLNLRFSNKDEYFFNNICLVKEIRKIAGPKVTHVMIILTSTGSQRHLVILGKEKLIN